MAYEFKVTRRVEFSETDMAGIVHFSNFFRYMETAESAFYRSLGFSVVLTDVRDRWGWPRVHAECDFRRPLRFEDEVEIHLLVLEKRSKVVSYQFRFNKLTGGQKEEVARGKVTIVCVTHLPDGRMTSTEIPPFLAEKIDVAPPELLQP